MTVTTSTSRLPRRTPADSPVPPVPAFPGPWLGGVALIAGPLLLLVGTALRLPFPFFFPHQLLAYQRHHGLLAFSYGAFLLGVVALWPAVVVVAARIAASRPGWAVWGGALVLTGLFARAFHYGVNTFAFALVDSVGTPAATRAVADYYGYPEHVAASLSLCVMVGWVVLAVGCYLTRTTGLVRAAALALMAGLMIGVLKGGTAASLVEVAGLAVAFVPLGVSTLRGAPRPRLVTVAGAAAFLVLSVVFGQLG